MKGSRKVRLLALGIAATGLPLLGIAASPPARVGVKREIVVDPSLNFVTTLGSSAVVRGVATDTQGDTYLGGYAYSSGFATTPGAFQATCPNGSNCAFVAKLDPSGALVYSTYLSGSSGDDIVFGIAVDSEGDAYVTGSAVSTDFPTTPNAFQPACATSASAQCADAFVAELNPTGSALVYSSYLGGGNVVATSNVINSLVQNGAGIAVDSSGAAYVTGQTNAYDFPVTPGAFQSTFTVAECGTSTEPATCDHAFVTKVAPGGGSLVYSTFLGGSNEDFGYGIAVDAGGDAYIAGSTSSFDFPTLDALQSSCTPLAGFPNICGNGFLAEIDPGGSELVFSTYFGGSGGTFPQGIALDSAANIYVTGYTNSKDFPTVNAFQASNASTFNPPDTPFFTEFAAGGVGLIYSTYLGGSLLDNGHGVAVDGFGEAFVTGFTTSPDFPVSNAIQSTNQGAPEDAFVTAFQAGGQGLIYSTYLGGPAGSSTAANGVAVDSQGDAWVGGDSDASTFGTTAGRTLAARRYGRQPKQLATAPTGTAALAASIALDAARVNANPASLSFGATVAYSTSAPETVTISNPGQAPLAFTSIAASQDYSVVSGGSCSTSSSVAPGASCTVEVAFAPTMGGDLGGDLTLADNGIGSPHKVSLMGTGQDFNLGQFTTARTVTPGTTASYQLQIGSQGGFAGAVALSCSGAPSNSTCTVTPSSVTLDGTNPQNVSLSVATTAPSAVIPVAPEGPAIPPAALWLAALAFLALAGMSLWHGRPARGISRPGWPSHKRRIPTARRAARILTSDSWLLTPALVILLFVALAASCGGGAAPATHTPTGGTAPGTYTLTVTATSGSLSHSSNVTLTVQ